MKVFVLGIDGMAYPLLNRFMQEGVMPTFSKLKKEGIYSSLRATIPPHTAPGWSTSLTGVNPGKHGIYQFWSTQEPSCHPRIMGSNDFGVPTVVNLLNQRGIKTGLVNVPMSHPPQKLDGFIISWPLEKTLRYCYPPEILYQVMNENNDYANDLFTMYHGEPQYHRYALDYIRKRLKTIRFLAKSREWDFFMTVFTETDRVSHYYWSYMDQPDTSRELRDAIKNVYMEMDAVLRELLDFLPDDTKLLVYSDHGFCMGKLDFYIQTFLYRNGFLSLKEREPWIKEPPDWFHAKSQNVYYTVDWPHTRAYFSAPGSYGINVNLKGRQAEGTVEKSDYETVREDIIRGLGNLCGPSGKPLFHGVYRREQIYHGKLVCQAPDLIVVPKDYGTMLSHRIVLDRLFSESPEQSGMHDTDGMFLLYDPDMESGRYHMPFSLEDVAPTVLDLFGIEIPGWMEGNSIVQSNEALLQPAAELQEQSADVTERLRNLGYL